MAGVDRITEEILQEAKAGAQELLGEAKKKAEAVAEQAREEASKIVENGEKEAAALLQQQHGLGQRIHIGHGRAVLLRKGGVPAAAAGRARAFFRSHAA